VGIELEFTWQLWKVEEFQAAVCMDSLKFWTKSSISFGVFSLVLRFIFEIIISRNLDQFVVLFVRHALLGLEEGWLSKERKTGV